MAFSVKAKCELLESVGEQWKSKHEAGKKDGQQVAALQEELKKMHQEKAAVEVQAREYIEKLKKNHREVKCMREYPS
jgi:septal ring factor EnvC (AmiA/AmiB activator)